jgi:GntR family transcriptional repressor for pyruvate dehydrogenase complex
MTRVQPSYQPLKREPKLADRATRQLQSLIINRAFEAGDRLPPERALAERLGVSRTVVREALRALSTKGLVEVRNGAGAFIRSPSADLFSELLGMCFARTESGGVTSQHLLEMRRIIEIEMAGLAAERRDARDLDEMQRLLAIMDEIAGRPEEWARADVDFHMAVAVAGKNPLFPIVLRSISDALMSGRLLAARLPATPGKALHHHRRIFAQLKKGSTSGARAAMERHLREAEQTMRLALARQATGRGRP